MVTCLYAKALASKKTKQGTRHPLTTERHQLKFLIAQSCRPLTATAKHHPFLLPFACSYHGQLTGIYGPAHINNWTTKNAFISEQCFVKTVRVSVHNSATVHAITASWPPFCSAKIELFGGTNNSNFNFCAISWVFQNRVTCFNKMWCCKFLTVWITRVWCTTLTMLSRHLLYPYLFL